MADCKTIMIVHHPSTAVENRKYK